MKLEHLNASHLGKVITITYPGDSITGQLAKVNHHADIIEDVTRLGSAERDLHLGARRTTIGILGWGERDWDPSARCEVEG